MAISETIVFTRANTSIKWPDEGIEVDNNDPLIVANVTSSFNVSEDWLTRTVIRTWPDSNTFVTCMSYSNTQYSTAWFQALVVPGLSFTKTIVTT